MAAVEESVNGEEGPDTQPFDLSSPRISRIMRVSGTNDPAFIADSARMPADKSNQPIVPITHALPVQPIYLMASVFAHSDVADPQN